ncbi:hypothetical protein FMZ73_07415 [Salmonella enterica subsp. enterica]|nr:hypothetical protein [Salmonella enterica subsp. enterica serovar Nigeria]ECJ1028202.1 hypothetical protein [Salmonella enterica subsp. enterica serovar Nigeria]EDG1633157.1 hypothetical protein [Salmonella enterica subsp. enterica serovar Nigeria]EGM6703111.1 hypothetical protein [Salmonella enterica subsp. enterica serovar Nigeria]
MFNSVKAECFHQYVILNNARVSDLVDRVEALEAKAERQQDLQEDKADFARVPEWDIPSTYSREQLEAAEKEAYSAGYADGEKAAEPAPEVDLIDYMKSSDLITLVESLAKGIQALNKKYAGEIA